MVSDRDPWEYAESHALMLADSLCAAPWSMAGTRNLVRHKGIDPAAVPAILLDRDGALPAPLPSTAERDRAERIELAEDAVVVRTPLWTELGRSSLRMDVRLVIDQERPDSLEARIERLVDASGDTVLHERDFGRWDAETPIQNVDDRPIAETRIRRGAFVGATLGVRIAQIEAGIDRSLGPFAIDHVSVLNEGQSAIVTLSWALTETYGDGFQVIYERGDDDVDERLVWAAARVGASAWSDLFRRAREVLPTEARGDALLREAFVTAHEMEWDPDSDTDPAGPLDVFDDEFYALEDRGDSLWDHMVRYIDANPSEFFFD